MDWEVWGRAWGGFSVWCCWAWPCRFSSFPFVFQLVWVFLCHPFSRFSLQPSPTPCYLKLFTETAFWKSIVVLISRLFFSMKYHRKFREKTREKKSFFNYLFVYLNVCYLICSAWGRSNHSSYLMWQGNWIRTKDKEWWQTLSVEYLPPKVRIWEGLARQNM